MRDVFRPTREPARTLYDAFQREAEKREGRDFEDWHSAEMNAVCNAARQYAQSHGLTVPTFEQVCDAEVSACGHVDYGSKWAYRVAEMMQNAETQRPMKPQEGLEE